MKVEAGKQQLKPSTPNVISALLPSLVSVRADFPALASNPLLPRHTWLLQTLADPTAFWPGSAFRATLCLNNSRVTPLEQVGAPDFSSIFAGLHGMHIVGPWANRVECYCRKRAGITKWPFKHFSVRSAITLILKIIACIAPCVW